MGRITHSRLENRVQSINHLLGRPEAPYTRNAEGKLRANIGNICLDYAYGGVGLHEIVTDGGGVRDLAGGHMTKRELDNFISGMMAVIYYLQEARP